MSTVKVQGIVSVMVPNEQQATCIIQIVSPLADCRVVAFFTAPGLAFELPVVGGLSPGREAVLVGVDLAEELAEEVESFEGGLRPVGLEGDERELLPDTGAVVGLLGDKAIMGEKSF